MTLPVSRVALRDRATRHFLVAGAGWAAGEGHPLVLERDHAVELVRRFACEPDAVELVDVDDLAAADLAVA